MKYCFDTFSSKGCFSTGDDGSTARSLGDDHGCFTTPNLSGHYDGRHEKKEVEFTLDRMWVKFMTYVGDLNGDMIAIGQLKFTEIDGDNNEVDVWKDAIFRVLIEASFQNRTLEVLGGWSDYVLLSSLGVTLNDIDYFSGFTSKTFGYSLTPSVQFRANGTMYWLDSFSFAVRGVGGGTYFGSNDYEYLSEDQSGTPSLNGIGEITRRYRTPTGHYTKEDAQKALYFDRATCEIKISDTADVFDTEYDYPGAKKVENIFGEERWVSLAELEWFDECDVDNLYSIYGKTCDGTEYARPGISKKGILARCYQNADPSVLMRGDSVFLSGNVYEYRHKDVMVKSIMYVKYSGSTTWDCGDPVWFEYTTTTVRVIGGEPLFKNVGATGYAVMESDNYITCFVGNDLRVFKKDDGTIIERDIGIKYGGALYDRENLIFYVSYDEDKKQSLFGHYWIE